jgi:hypothetical protein
VIRYPYRRRRRRAQLGCLAWSLSFIPFVFALAWPFMVLGGSAGWAVSVIWWLLLGVLFTVCRRR